MSILNKATFRYKKVYLSENTALYVLLLAGKILYPAVVN